MAKETNTYKAQRRSRARVTAVVILALIYLLGATTFDVFVQSPKKAERVEQVMVKFNEFSEFMDAKIPQMDSALIRHERQIADQNTQLLELNKLTKILKEENEEE